MALVIFNDAEVRVNKLAYDTAPELLDATGRFVDARKVTRFLRYLILAVLIFSNQCMAATFRAEPWYGNRYHIVLRGEILQGDADKFHNLVLTQLRAGHLISAVELNSEGGSVQDGLRIGSEIRILEAATVAPTKQSDGSLYCRVGGLDFSYNDNVMNGKTYCMCASSCFLIWSGGVNRQGSNLGIHRPRYDASYFRNLSGEEAKSRYNSMDSDIRSYLTRMGIPGGVTDRMFQVSSGDVQYLSETEIGQLANEPGWQAELTLARCGKNFSRGFFYTNPERKSYVECAGKVFEDEARDAAQKYLDRYGNAGEKLPKPATTPDDIIEQANRLISILTDCEIEDNRTTGIYHRVSYLGDERTFKIAWVLHEGGTESFEASLNSITAAKDGLDSPVQIRIDCKDSSSCVRRDDGAQLNYITFRACSTTAASMIKHATNMLVEASVDKATILNARQQQVSRGTSAIPNFANQPSTTPNIIKTITIKSTTAGNVSADTPSSSDPVVTGENEASPGEVRKQPSPSNSLARILGGLVGAAGLLLLGVSIVHQLKVVPYFSGINRYAGMFGPLAFRRTSEKPKTESRSNSEKAKNKNQSAGTKQSDETARHRPQEKTAKARMWYEVLEVAYEASPTEIKAAYLKALKKCHPDTVADRSASIQEAASAETKQINAAFNEARLAKRI